jgi:ribose 5-phosphate isomerase B
VDYPDYAAPAARRVAAGEFDAGILICGTGQGMVIAANKVRGIRAVCPHDEYTARMSRSHNNANIACFGYRSMPIERTIQILDEWISTSFEGGRHARRLEKVRKLEE